MGVTVVTGGTVLPGEGAEPIEVGAVRVEGNVVTEVGPTSEVDHDGADRIVDAGNTLTFPGLINAHTHLCMILGRNLGADRALLHWLSDAQVPLMRALEPDDYGLSMQLGAAENLLNGTTTVCEVFFSPHYEQEVDHIAADALDASGIRSVLVRCSNDESFFDGFVENRADIVERARSLIDAWHGRGRTQVGVGPLVPWGSSEASFRDTVELSDDRDVVVHLHTAETPEYNNLVRERTGRSNIGMLRDVGALGPQVMLNHCVFLSPDDVAAIAATGAHAIHDPTSNMILASGAAPVPDLRAAGVNLALACDGPACNNGQDMIETMKMAALLQKVVTRNPSALVAEDVFAMATAGGARSIGMGDRLGRLAPGYLADLVVLDTDAPHLSPLHDPVGALVYSARGSDVRTVLVDGAIVVDEREPTRVDVATSVAHGRERARRARLLAQ